MLRPARSGSGLIRRGTTSAVTGQQLVNRREQRGGRKRFVEHPRRAQQPGRLEVDRGACSPTPGYGDDVHGRIGAPKLPHHLEPLDLRHHKVCDHQVCAGLPKEVESVPPIARFNHGVPI